MAKQGDHFYHKAKAQGKLARSYFKLEEIEKKYKFFRNAKTVLDLGAAPGAWTQYLLESTPVNVIAIDLSPMKLNSPRLQAYIGDVFEDSWAKGLPHVDGVLSDLAPKTTGITTTDQIRSLELFQRAWEIMNMLGKPNGFFVGKIFQSHEAMTFIKTMNAKKIDIERPDATRRTSSEIYVIARGILGKSP